VAIAGAAVAGGAAVELAGRVGGDEDGDHVVLDLARRGIGHAALLRVGGLSTPALEGGSTTGLAAADVDLALRYLPAYRVIVVTEELDPAVLGAAIEAASWAAAQLVVIGEKVAAAADLPEGSTILQPPGDEPDGAFASLVGAYAAALDGGTDPDSAFTELAASFHAERIG
jgi:hypothetical protein